jgi:transketolase
MESIRKLRRRILDVAYRDGMGHIPSALSILDIVWTLYDRIMTPDDQFILSKGHGVMALYAVLEEKGLMSWNEKLMGHPKRGGAILASTGSLGHGLPIAVGLAKAKKIKGEGGRVFCLIGDGECNEGTTWESALIASHHNLGNLITFVDWNGSSERALAMNNIRQKFLAFDWFANSLATGEPFDFEKGYEKPVAIIARTIKGRGVTFMENDPSWHNRKLTKEEYEKAKSY